MATVSVLTCSQSFDSHNCFNLSNPNLSAAANRCWIMLVVVVVVGDGDDDDDV